MLDHVFLSVSDIERSVAFYTKALAPLGITDPSIMTVRMARGGILISRVSVARGASSSGCGKLWPIPGGACIRHPQSLR